MYRLYLKQNGEQLLLPVTPAEIETRMGNRNKTAYILDFGEMNLAKKPGLTEIRFTALLPGRAYSFVQTEGGFREPEYFLNRFKEYKASAKPVQMILFRRLADGKQKFCGNTEVLKRAANRGTSGWNFSGRNGERQKVFVTVFRGTA